MVYEPLQMRSYWVDLCKYYIRKHYTNFKCNKVSSGIRLVLVSRYCEIRCRRLYQELNSG